MLHQIVYSAEIIVLIYLSIQVFYLLFFAISGHIFKKKQFPKAKKFRSIRIFVPGYKEDSVIISTAENLLAQDYPIGLFEVVVIADSFSAKTLETLKKLPIRVVEVLFEKSTKGKALQKAIEATKEKEVDIVLILDADNHLSVDFLHKLNDAFEAGYMAVQGHRTAKNLNTAFALLDACTEEINNHIFRRGHVAVNLPSALIGSGMAFDWKIFTRLLEDIGETSGEDKELEFRLMREKVNIAFLDNQYVLDEKVAKSDVFSKQRSRWLATQVEFFEKYFIEGWFQLFKGNIGFFNKVFQTYLFPRIMLIAVLGLFVMYTFFFANYIFNQTLILFVLLVFTLLISIPKKWFNKQLLMAFLEIPIAFLGIIVASKNIGKAKKTFIHTPHGEE